MRVMVFVKEGEQSEAGVLPPADLVEKMQRTTRSW